MIIWNDIKKEGYPKMNTPCFIKVFDSIQIAYWNKTIKEWDNPVYGGLPRVYDDEGTYPVDVRYWAYVPDELIVKK